MIGTGVKRLRKYFIVSSVADISILKEVSESAVKVTYSAPMTDGIIKYEAFGIFAENDPIEIPTEKTVDEFIARFTPFSKKIWDTKEWYPDVINHDYNNTTIISDNIYVYMRSPPCSIFQNQFKRGERAHIPIRHSYTLIPVKRSADSAIVVAMCKELMYETECDSVVWQRQTDSWNGPVYWLAASEITVDHIYQSMRYGNIYDSRVDDMNSRRYDNQHMYKFGGRIYDLSHKTHNFVGFF